jgi:hypothetical protein
MRKATALAATLLSLALGPPSSAAGPAPTLSDAQRERLACDFGETVIRSLDAQSLMDLAPVAPADIGPKDDPAVAAWRARGPTNLLTACPHLKDLLPPGVRFATPEDHAEAARTIGARSVFITRFAVPYVSPDGQQLLHVQTWKCPGLCGGYVLSRLRRKGAGWSEPEMLAMSIS